MAVNVSENLAGITHLTLLAMGTHMHTVERLETALALARQLGYRIREEWLDGRGGGGCEINGQKWIFLDLALSADEQLERVLDALRGDPAVVGAAMSDELRDLGVRRSA